MPEAHTGEYPRPPLDPLDPLDRTRFHAVRCKNCSRGMRLSLLALASMKLPSTDRLSPCTVNAKPWLLRFLSMVYPLLCALKVPLLMK